MWDSLKEEIEKYLFIKGIDIHGRYYKTSKEYKKIRDERIFGGSDFSSMSLDEFIERFLLSEQEVVNTYESIYEMGNPQELTEDQCEDISVAKEIITMYTFIQEADVEAEAYEFVKKFYRKGGLLDRLNKSLQFDLDAFDKNNKRYKRERCKIIYFFYALEHDGFDGYNVLDLLSKPSMENIDNRFLVSTTCNGKIIRAIKSPLEKELPMQMKGQIKKGVAEIVAEWDNILSNAYLLMDFLYENECEYDFESTIHILMSGSEDSKVSYENTFSPIEVLYLKLVQHEYMGNVKDIDMINGIQKNYDFNISPEIMEEMQKLHYSLIDIENVEQYIENNAKRISKYVYLREKTNKDEVKKIRNAKKKVHKWLDFCTRAKPMLDIRHVSNELQIISFLQAVVLDDASELFEYTFYHYENKNKHMKHVQAALKNDDYVPHALQCYWVRKVTDRWYANIGRYDGRLKVRELEKTCDRILEEILSEPTLFGMQKKHEFYLSRVDDGLITTPTQICAVQRFEKYINTIGFEYIDACFLIRYIFLYPPEVNNTYLSLTKMIDWAVKNNEDCLDVYLEAHSADYADMIKFNFVLNFDYQSKVCIIKDFNYEI